MTRRSRSASSRPKRYAAKLLFQFRVMVANQPGKRRICEERIVVLNGGNAREALAAAKRRGKGAEFNYRNDEGNPVFFEFVGVIDLLHLGVECDEDEVWYDIVERLTPTERRGKLIPKEKDLCAIRNRQ